MISYFRNLANSRLSSSVLQCLNALKHLNNFLVELKASKDFFVELHAEPKFGFTLSKSRKKCDR